MGQILEVKKMNKYQEALYRQKSNVKKLRDKEFVEYRDDFTTLQELVDKATPKKPKTTMNEHNSIDELCPVCNRTVASYDNYCGKCGQRIGGIRR